jgi:hypothetical protein
MKFVVLILLLGIFGLNWTSGYDGDEIDPVSGCPMVLKKCKCGRQRTYLWHPERNDTYVVNCTNTNYQKSTPLQQIPKETEVLIFNGNRVPYMVNNVIGMTNEHELLKVIDFSNNRIQEISGKAFHKVSNVEKLILDHNDLSISGDENHPRMFTNFANLKELHLTNAFSENIDSKYYMDDFQTMIMAALAEGVDKLMVLKLGQNELWSIKDEFFCSDMFPALSHLDLSSNQLYDLNFQFECIKNLKYLDIGYNKIKRLNDKTLARIDGFFRMPHTKDDIPRKINLVGNPFVCDCNLSHMFHWLSSTNSNLRHREELRCYTGIPEANAGRKILNVGLLYCSDSNGVPRTGNHHTSSSSGITHTLLVILIILIACLLAALLYIHKEKVHSNLQTFQRSMQYRTIEKDLSETTHIPNGLQAGLPPEVNV